MQRIYNTQNYHVYKYHILYVEHVYIVLTSRLLLVYIYQHIYRNNDNCLLCMSLQDVQCVYIVLAFNTTVPKIFMTA